MQCLKCLQVFSNCELLKDDCDGDHAAFSLNRTRNSPSLLITQNLLQKQTIISNDEVLLPVTHRVTINSIRSNTI